MTSLSSAVMFFILAIQPVNCIVLPVYSK